MRTPNSVLLRCVGVALFGCLLANMGSAAVIREDSDYGVGALTLAACVAPSAGVTFNGVTASCNKPGSNANRQGDTLFTFSLANPSASIFVNSFTVNFATPGSDSFGLVRCAPTVSNFPCTPSGSPVTLNGTINNVGATTLNFGGFNGTQSGMVTVYFDTATAITNITTNATTAVPEPGSFGLITIALMAAFGLLGRQRRMRRVNQSEC